MGFVMPKPALPRPGNYCYQCQRIMECYSRGLVPEDRTCRQLVPKGVVWPKKEREVRKWR